MKKFTISRVEVNSDTDILFEDVKNGFWKLESILEDAAQHKDIVHIVVDHDDDVEKAEKFVALLNHEWESDLDIESEIFGDLRFERENASAVSDTSEDVTTPSVVATLPQEIKKEETQMKTSVNIQPQMIIKKEESEMNIAFSTFADHILDLAGVQTPVKPVKEEVKVSAAVQNVQKSKSNRVSTVKAGVSNKANRVSSTSRVLASAAKKSSPSTKRRLDRRLITKQVTVQKFQGPWYLNKSLHPVLERLGSLVETFKDEKLGITDILTVDPSEFGRKNDYVAVQVQFGNGVFLNLFLDKVVKDGVVQLRAKNIAWREVGGKLTPFYVTWRKNALQAVVDCACGKKFEVAAGVKTKCSCGKEHLVQIEVKSENRGVHIPTYTKQGVDRYIQINKDVLVLALAFAHWAEGFDMFGLLEGDHPTPDGDGSGGGAPAPKKSVENVSNFGGDVSPDYAQLQKVLKYLKNELETKPAQVKKQLSQDLDYLRARICAIPSFILQAEAEGETIPDSLKRKINTNIQQMFDVLAHQGLWPESEEQPVLLDVEGPKPRKKKSSKKVTA